MFEYDMFYEEVCDDCEQQEMDEYTGCAVYKRFQDEWN